MRKFIISYRVTYRKNWFSIWRSELFSMKEIQAYGMPKRCLIIPHSIEPDYKKLRAVKIEIIGIVEMQPLDIQEFLH